MRLGGVSLNTRTEGVAWTIKQCSKEVLLKSKLIVSTFFGCYEDFPIWLFVQIFCLTWNKKFMIKYKFSSEKTYGHNAPAYPSAKFQ